MKSINLFSLCFLIALGASKVPVSEELAVAAIAEKLSNQAADKINETPKVEEKGGIRQQVLHKGANLASSTLVDKGLSMVMTAAAKYPLVAVAAPVALPVAKAVAGALILNQVHKKINGMFDNKNSTMTPEEAKAEEEARNARGEQAAGVLSKVTSFFKKDDGAKEEKKAEGEATDAAKSEKEASAEGDATEEAQPEEPQKEEAKKEETKKEEAKKEESKKEEQKSEEDPRKE